jgi:group I intron endonuclease
MKNNNNNRQMIVPVVSYLNLDIDKSLILKENNGKSGIYRLNNLINRKSYIGSAKCLTGRLSVYYSSASLRARLERGSSIIHRALLKHDYSNFSLDILEYCEPNKLITREQYYLDLLKPEYNICKTADSTLGKMHSESTKEKIRNSLTGKNNPNFGKHLSYERRKNIGKAIKLSNKIRSTMPKMRLETKLKLSLVTIGVNVKMYDCSKNLIKEFPSINSAAKYFDVHKTTINTVIKKVDHIKILHLNQKLKIIEFEFMI